MKKAITILPFIIAVSFILASCSSSVRFAEKTKSNTTKKSNTVKPEPQKKSNYSANQDFFEDELADKIIKEANSWIGVPYRYAGESKSGADCSGFVMSVFSVYGFALPRTAQLQWENTKSIERRNLRKADLIFFSDGGKVDHVGIYIGENRFIHASTSKGVIITELSKDYYVKRLKGFGRVSGIY